MFINVMNEDIFDVTFSIYLDNQIIRQWRMQAPRPFIEIAGTAGIDLLKANRGTLMKSVSMELKGKVDMKIVSAVVGGLLK